MVPWRGGAAGAACWSSTFTWCRSPNVSSRACRVRSGLPTRSCCGAMIGKSWIGCKGDASRSNASPPSSSGSAPPLANADGGAARSRHDIPWTLGYEWFVVVVALHTLVGAALAALVSPWWAVAAALGCAFKMRSANPGERYLLLAFEDAIEVRRGNAVLPRRGPCWMTDRWLVIPTTRRVLPVRRGRLSPQDFARLRRAAVAGG